MKYSGSEKENNNSGISREMPAVCGFILTIGGLKTSSARPLRSLAERRSGVLPTSVRLRWRSAELPLERNVPRFKSYRFLAPPIPLNSAVGRPLKQSKNRG